MIKICIQNKTAFSVFVRLEIPAHEENRDLDVLTEYCLNNSIKPRQLIVGGINPRNNELTFYFEDHNLIQCVGNIACLVEGSEYKFESITEAKLFKSSVEEYIHRYFTERRIMIYQLLGAGDKKTAQRLYDFIRWDAYTEIPESSKEILKVFPWNYSCAPNSLTKSEAKYFIDELEVLLIKTIGNISDRKQVVLVDLSEKNEEWSFSNAQYYLFLKWFGYSMLEMYGHLSGYFKVNFSNINNEMLYSILIDYIGAFKNAYEKTEIK